MWKPPPSLTPKEIKDFWKDADDIHREVMSWPAWQRGEPANESPIKEDE